MSCEVSCDPDDLPPTGHLQIPWDARSFIRLLAFYIANGTLVVQYTDAAYDDLIAPPGPILGQLFQLEMLSQLGLSPCPVAEWLYKLIDKGSTLPIPDLPSDAPAWMPCVIRFADDFGYRRSELLQEVNSEIPLFLDGTYGGSCFEMVMAVLGNVIQLNAETGSVSNAAAAHHRAYEMARHLMDSPWTPTRAFEQWEMLLCL